MPRPGDRSVICPVTGLPVIERDDWTNIRLHDAYQMTIRILDNRILSINSEGDMSRLDADRAFPIRNKIIADRFGDRPYVELRSYERLHGMLTAEQRRKHAHHWLHSPGKMAGLILYNTPVHVRMAAHLGKRIFHTPSQMVICKNYQEAVRAARRILSEKAPAQKAREDRYSLTLDQLIDDPRWHYEAVDSGAQFRNAVIPHRLFYSSLSGKFTYEDSLVVAERLEQIFKDGWLGNDEIFRIADYTNMKGGSFKARKQYARILTNLYSKYRCRPVTTYVVGASYLMRTALLFGVRESEQNLVFVDTIERAMDDINHRAPSLSNVGDHLIAVRQSDLDDLIRSTGSFVWRTDRAIKVPKGSPFERVYDALELIRNDLHEAQSKEEQARSEAERLAAQAEALNRVKNEFLANVNQEIRAPMNGILGTLERLQTSELSGDQRGYVETALQSSRVLLGLLGGIVDISTKENAALTLEKVPFDLVHTMDDIMEMMAATAGHAGLDLYCLVDPRIPPNLVGDPVRLRQILSQLIGNAMKFTREGEVDVRVRLEDTRLGDLVLRFSVRDTGVGIEKDRQNGIFHAFGRSAEGRNRGPGGLGLVVARQLVQAMRGQIKVESVPSEGSTFWFTAVFQRGESTEIARVEVPAARVLVVDDSATSRFVLTTLLSAWGCRIEVAATGKLALERMALAKVHDDPFALVFLDQIIPDMSFEDLVRQIAAEREHAGVHIVALARPKHGPLEHVEHVDEVLEIPVRQRKLQKCLRRLLGEEPME